jgi:hypothetical protein
MKRRRSAARAAGALRGAIPGGTRRAVGWLSAACVLMLAGPPGHAAAAEPTGTAGLEQVLQLFAARRHGHVTFSEVQHLAMLERPLQSAGELLYDAPDHLEKRTLRPKVETLILENGVLTAHRGARTYRLSLREYPQVVPYVESIRATLAGDRAALERFFTPQFSGTLEHWGLTLVPSDATVARTVKEVRIEGERDAIHTVRITQTDGDASVLSIGSEVSP